jgi:hypothetical protein
LLETPLECSVLLDVLAVLGKCGRTDAADLASRQGWLEEIRCVYSSTRAALTRHESMQLVDEQHYSHFRFLALIKYTLQTLLKLAFIRGCGVERSQYAVR